MNPIEIDSLYQTARERIKAADLTAALHDHKIEVLTFLKLGLHERSSMDETTFYANLDRLSVITLETMTGGLDGLVLSELNTLKAKDKNAYWKLRKVILRKAKRLYVEFAERLPPPAIRPTYTGTPLQAFQRTSGKRSYSIQYGYAEAVQDGASLSIDSTFLDSLNAPTKLVLRALIAAGKQTLPQYDRYLNPAQLTDHQISVIDRRRLVRLSVEQYADLRQISYDTAYQQITRAVEVLTNLKVKCTETRYVYTKTRHKRLTEIPLDCSILYADNDRPIKGGVLDIKFDMDFAKWLATGAYFLTEDTRFYTIDTKKYQHTLDIYFAMERQYNLYAQGKAPNRLKVGTILSYLPDLPAHSRHWKREIYRPFTANLYALQNKYQIFDIEYVRQHGVIIEPEEIENANWEEWNAMEIEFTAARIPASTPSGNQTPTVEH